MSSIYSVCALMQLQIYQISANYTYTFYIYQLFLRIYI
jgi:hypothetical protein